MQRRIEMREWQRKLRERLPALSGPDFVARHVRPLLEEQVPEAECKVDLVRSWPTGRMTLRYAFDNGITVYGKVYTSELGRASYAALHRMWGNGFGPLSADQVPEPLGFCVEENLLLMRAARGAALDTLLLREPIE